MWIAWCYRRYAGLIDEPGTVVTTAHPWPSRISTPGLLTGICEE